MAHAASLHTAPVLDIEHEAAPAQPERPSLWQRISAAFMAGRQKQAEDEVARYLARTGGVLTDSIERDVINAALGGGRRSV